MIVTISRDNGALSREPPQKCGDLEFHESERLIQSPRTTVARIHCQSQRGRLKRMFLRYIAEKQSADASVAKLWNDKQFIHKQQCPPELVAPVGNQKRISP